jgi:hypothetical protein
MMVKLELGDGATAVDLESYLREPPATKGLGRFTELFRKNPLLPKRITARAGLRGRRAVRVRPRGRGQRRPAVDRRDRSSRSTDLLSLF